MKVAETKSNEIAMGTVATIDGVKRIYFDGYWIRYYAPPAESWDAKRKLISGLTRRTFHHTEPGINTPGENLELARKTYEQTTSEGEKRVAAAMLAGALFNRATDIFTTIADLENKGVHISYENELLRECSECLEEAMELGKSVRHVSGNEGINELWGEPLKAFTMSLYDFYISRYIKISLSMREMDSVNVVLANALSPLPIFNPVIEAMLRFTKHAKRNCETMKSDLNYFSIWPKFVTSSDLVKSLVGDIKGDCFLNKNIRILKACELVEWCRQLISYISAARVPIPQTTSRFIQDCKKFNRSLEN